MRPTVDGDGRTQEVYIFDFNKDIYGEKITVEIVGYIRPELKFNGLPALVKAIEEDCAVALKMLQV
ncbi:MAG: riboflavin kinase [Spirosomataceae bacterium]